MRHLRKFLSLPSGDQKLLVVAFFLVVAVRLGLWLLPFSWVRRSACGVAQFARKAKPISVGRLAGSIDLASRYVPQATCLTKAFAAQILLSKNGYKPLLRIGVRRDGHGNFQAHAWIENEGTIIGGLDDLHTYATLPPL